MLLVLASLWGASFMFIKVGVRELHPTTLVCLRLGIGALTLLPLLVVRIGVRESARLMRASLGPLVLTGLVNSAIPIVSLSWAEKRIDSGLPAIVFVIAMHLEIAADPNVPGDAIVDFQFGHGGAPVILYWFLVQGFFMNVVLFIFNMLPIPGIDGYMVFRGLLGGVIPDVFRWMDQNRQIVWFGAIALLFLLPQLSGGNTNPLATVINHVQDFLYGNFVTRDFPLVGGFPSLFNALSS